MTDPETTPAAWMPGPDLQALNEALAKAQGAFPPIPRDKTVTVTSQRTGSSYSFAYAPLDSILKAVRPALAENGLSLVQRLEAPGQQPALRTELRHSGGGVLASSFPLPPMPAELQALGSQLTYLRRYAISALLCIATEEDDDGQRGARIGGAIPEASAASASPEEPAAGASSSFKPPAGSAELLTEPQRKKIMALRSKLTEAGAFTEDAYRMTLASDFDVEHTAELTKAQASQLIERLVRVENEQGFVN